MALLWDLVVALVRIRSRQCQWHRRIYEDLSAVGPLDPGSCIRGRSGVIKKFYSMLNLCVRTKMV